MFRKMIWGKLLAWAQIFLFLLCIGTAFYLLHLTVSPEITSDKDAAEAIYGLKIGAGVVAGFGSICGVAGVALLLRKKWGWWIGLLTTVAVLLLCLFDQWEERQHPDTETWYAIVAFAILMFWFFVPGVRNYLVATNAAKVVEGTDPAPTTENSSHG